MDVEVMADNTSPQEKHDADSSRLSLSPPMSCDGCDQHSRELRAAWLASSKVKSHFTHSSRCFPRCINQSSSSTFPAPSQFRLTHVSHGAVLIAALTVVVLSVQG
ncbi:hypothetical protein CB1_000632012 [Camelus ferus]|nr:hypothetical protein CB1_000632012 [Camelus ferus]